jgi:hypothetical protein
VGHALACHQTIERVRLWTLVGLSITSDVASVWPSIKQRHFHPDGAHLFLCDMGSAEDVRLLRSLLRKETELHDTPEDWTNGQMLMGRLKHAPLGTAIAISRRSEIKRSVKGHGDETK